MSDGDCRYSARTENARSVSLDRLKEPDMEGLKEGLRNLDKHVHNLRQFGQSVVVAYNRFACDTDEEIELVRQHCERLEVALP